MANKRRGLGRGLDALLGTEKATVSPEAIDAQLSKEIPVEWIRAGKYQPRQSFNEESLEDLAASIRVQGIMQPVVVRPIGDNQYELIAGERRWRAAQKAGLEKVPAIIKVVNDEAAVAMSLIENIQRENLNPIEEAGALHRLIEEFQLTHQEIADAVGKSRTAVTNYLRLVNLAEAVKNMLLHGKLEMGHARALLTQVPDEQVKLAHVIVARGLNVRQAEALVRSARTPPAPTKQVDADTRHLQDRLTERLGQPVAIRHSSRGKGSLTIQYGSLDELDGILQFFGDIE